MTTHASHIGIVGVSPEGAALFYQRLSRHFAHLPPEQHPTISLHNEPLVRYIGAIQRGDWHQVGALLAQSAQVLSRCGATFCVTPDNAVQHAIHLAQGGSPMSWLTMTDIVAKRIASEGRKTVGVIGTSMVTTSSTYQSHLGLRGVRVLAPEPEEIRDLDRIIFEELIYGEVKPGSRQRVVGIIEHLARRGCDGVILGCSEAPLLITAEIASIHIYDSIDILAQETLEHAARPA